MQFYTRGIETNRAFVAFDNIQHISWKWIKDNEVECKIHTASKYPVIQTMKDDSFLSFLKLYKEYMGCVG